MSSETHDSRESPLEPKITLDLIEAPAHALYSRYLIFQDYAGRRKRLLIAFRQAGMLRLESNSFPEGIDALTSLVEQGNRRYWDHMYLENRNDRRTLKIRRLEIVMRYADAPGRSPEHLNHREIPIVASSVDMSLLAADEICLDEFARRSRYAWCDLQGTDPPWVRMVAADLGKSGSDGAGQDQYANNPKYGGRIDMLCSEFVTWYYHQAAVKVNGQSLHNITGTQQMHDLFRAEGTLYRYDSGSGLQAFVNAKTGQRYTPRPGDFLERRQSSAAQHAMMMYRWLPGDPNAANTHNRYNRAIVLNGPWPVTLRLVRIQEDEASGNVDFWLGRIG